MTYPKLHSIILTIIQEKMFQCELFSAIISGASGQASVAM